MHSNSFEAVSLAYTHPYKQRDVGKYSFFPSCLYIHYRYVGKINAQSKRIDGWNVYVQTLFVL